MESIRNFYTKNYPTDTLGLEINPKATFLGLLVELVKNKDVYKYIKVSDSLVRERVFEGLSDATGLSYNTIYDLWIAV